ncbi:MAG: energy-coupling factor transporter transmembrane component T, partial [bacterium]|nr:energy-coupling factor transporter transmembrane component T [bacterium]
MNPIPNRSAQCAPHPVCLLLGAISFLICLVLVRRIEGFAFLMGLWIFMIATLRLRLRPILLGVLRLWPFLLLTGLFHAFLSSHETVELNGFIRISVDSHSISSALFFVGRLALILSVSIALFQAHSPQSYGSSAGRALSRIRAGKSAFSQADLVISLALRFIPFLEQELQRIRLALAARGLT